MEFSQADIVRLRRIVWRYYKVHGRHDLPWRRTENPYDILVSEVMLQQTQVGRVVPKYVAFLKHFPTINALALAPLREVLVQWQGLGYNRRAKMLHEASCAVVEQYAGKMPDAFDELCKLPGVGAYTAGAVCAFAHNRCVSMVETNIRTVLFHHLLHEHDGVADSNLLQITNLLCPRGRAREWYWALMDYGAHLKGQGVRVNYKSKHYAKQSKFEGSDRQLRGAIVRVCSTEQSITVHTLVRRLQADLTNAAPERIRAQLDRLVREGFLTRDGSRVHA